MEKPITDLYRGWTISVTADSQMCANYSFDIISPGGDSLHVAMGGIDIATATRRAREMIDMEIALAADE